MLPAKFSWALKNPFLGGKGNFVWKRFLRRDRNYFADCCALAASSGLMTSIFAPFFISSADGTLMMSLVSGAAGATTGAGGAGWVLTSSTSKIKTEFGGMPGRPFSP